MSPLGMKGNCLFHSCGEMHLLSLVNASIIIAHIKRTFAEKNVTAPRHKWRGFTGSEVLGLDNHRARIVTTADF